MTLHTDKTTAERAADRRRGILPCFMHHFTCSCHPDVSWGLYPSADEAPRTACPRCGALRTPSESWEQ